jgi:predicted amidohydrolase
MVETGSTERRRLVRLLPIPWPSDDRPGTIEGNVRLARRLVEAVEPGAVDIACFPEGFLYHGVPAGTVHERVARDLDDLVKLFGSLARDLGAWLFVPMVGPDGGALRSLVVALDRDGAVRGRYAKLHPWPSSPGLTSLELGVVPGSSADAVSTEFGAIGIQTCFDVNWTRGWDELRRQGCTLVLFPSDYPGGFALRVRAWQVAAPILASVLRGPSRLIDIDGDVVARISADEHPTVLALNLNRCLVHLDHAWKELAALDASDPALTIRRLEDDNIVLVEGPPDGPPVEELLGAVGIRPLNEYLDRARVAIEGRELLAATADDE